MPHNLQQRKTNQLNCTSEQNPSTFKTSVGSKSLTNASYKIIAIMIRSVILFVETK